LGAIDRQRIDTAGRMLKKVFMLREPQRERDFFTRFESFSVRHFDKLSAGSEFVEGLRDGFSAACWETDDRAFAPSFLCRALREK